MNRDVSRSRPASSPANSPATGYTTRPPWEAGGVPVVPVLPDPATYAAWLARRIADRIRGAR